MSKKIKVPSMYNTWEFHEVGNKLDYKMISKQDGSMCGWIRKFCVDEEKVIKEK